MVMLRLQVREIAERKGYSIRQLSKQSGLAYPTVLGYWHNRVRRIDIVVLQKLADTLEVRITDFFREDTDQETNTST